jgi:hypothetical protein
MTKALHTIKPAKMRPRKETCPVYNLERHGTGDPFRKIYNLTCQRPGCEYCGNPNDQADTQ